jgi:hypothetical protein
MTRQDIEAEGQSVAIQSARDTNIQTGLTAQQMGEILAALAAQTSVYAKAAQEIVDDRLKDFAERLLPRFADPQKARSEAFRDPDFQYLLGKAQHTYARSGDAEIRDILIDLISERSKQKDRTRLALSLNEAVEKAALLTANEFAELSLVYLLRYTKQTSVVSVASLVSYLKTYIVPLLPDISNENTSYSYIQAQGCGNIELVELDLMGVLRHSYLGIIVKGFAIEEITASLPDDKKNVFDNSNLVIRSLHNSDKFQLNATNKEVFVNLINNVLSASEIDLVWGVQERSVLSEQELIDKLRPPIPEFETLLQLWNSTPLHKMTLNPVGIAIAHANVTRVVPDFRAGLNIWIK